MSNPLTVAYIGNFGEHNTETHVARALEANGHFVERIQENSPVAFNIASSHVAGSLGPVDLILWTRTGWDWCNVYRDERGDQFAHGHQRSMLAAARRKGIPTVAFHLDVWRRLPRESQLSEPFFECDLVVTADGSDENHWKQLGINHLWFLPGVSRAECEPGMLRSEFQSRLAFVGSWQGGYHPEHQHRFELVKWLQKNFRRDCAFWPKPGHHAVRGTDLRDLYASVDIAVGDSCFSGDGIGRYCSDRLPESMGRGALLLHPRTPGVTDGSITPSGPSWHEGLHLACWNAGDWDQLGTMIETLLSNPEARREIARGGREFTIAEHTYEVRMRQLVEALTERGML
jgi:hypothetical protein